MSPASLPEDLLVSFYGDDYTGSSAVMEVLTFAGVETVLFLANPTPEQRARFSHMRAMGIAGVARSKSPEWMRTNLPPIFDDLARQNAELFHYKVCSTFDSAPHIGSIGVAAEIASHSFGAGFIPMVIAAPAFGRYQAFGNLFASVEGVGHRLDRHPTMAHHPVTPMTEADLGLHLARQTDLPVGVVDLVSMSEGRADAALDAALETAKIVSFDVLDTKTLETIGRLIWERRKNVAFCIGSQGVQYALAAYWHSIGAVQKPSAEARVMPVKQTAVVSGSCSPVTGRQIRYAEDHGFTLVNVDAKAAIDEGEWRKEIGRAERAALDILSSGASPLMATAKGVDDPAIPALREAVKRSGVTMETVNQRIGSGLGQLMSRLKSQSDLRRIILSGGDTSGYAASELEIFALTAIAPLAPGSALCRGYSNVPDIDGIELALKGGQVGKDDFFAVVRDGK